MLLLDKNTRSVQLDGRVFSLTGIEFKLLDHLLAHQGEVCRRDELIDQVWGKHFLYDTGTLDVHIAALRRKMGPSGTSLIHTVRGVGYIIHTQSSDKTLFNQQDLHWTRMFSELLPSTLEEVELEALFFELIEQYRSKLQAAGFTCRLQLCPFVQSILSERATLRMIIERMFDHLLFHCQLPPSPTLTISSSLGMQAFVISLRCNGSCADWSPLIVAQRLAALLGMPMHMGCEQGLIGIELSILLKK